MKAKETAIAAPPAYQNDNPKTYMPTIEVAPEATIEAIFHGVIICFFIASNGDFGAGGASSAGLTAAVRAGASRFRRAAPTGASTAAAPVRSPGVNPRKASKLRAPQSFESPAVESVSAWGAMKREAAGALDASSPWTR